MKKLALYTWITCAIVALAIVVLVALKLWQDPNQTRLAQATPPALITTTPLGGTFTLTDEQGQVVTDQTYRHRLKLVFFGFTHCPAICPTELLKMADIMTGLGPQAAQIYPLFITIDPERDSAPLLRDYTAEFHDQIIGLTGTEEQISQVITAFKVYAAKVPQDPGYTMDHSTFLYLTDHDNHVIHMYRMEEDAATIVKDIQSRL